MLKLFGYALIVFGVMCAVTLFLGAFIHAGEGEYRTVEKPPFA